MTAGQVLDYARTLMGPAGAALATGHLLTLLNIAQEEVSREAKLPRKVVQYTNLTADNQLVLPADARKEALTEAYAVGLDDGGAVDSSRNIPILDFVTASRLYPQWTTWESQPWPTFLMYDPAHNPDVPRPAPAPSPEHPQSIRVVYVQRPAPLTGLDSPIFDDKFDGLHTILAYRVAYLVLRDGAMLQEYERRMHQLAGQARPPGIVARNALYAAGALRGSR